MILFPIPILIPFLIPSQILNSFLLKEIDATTPKTTTLSNLGVGTPEFVNTPEGGSTGDEMELNQTDLQYEKKVGRLYSQAGRSAHDQSRKKREEKILLVFT